MGVALDYLSKAFDQHTQFSAPNTTHLNTRDSVKRQPRMTYEQYDGVVRKALNESRSEF